MPRTHPPYPPEYRQQIVELALVGRSPIELAREFEPSEQTIRDWIKQAEIDTDPVRFTTQSARDCAVLDAGERHDGTPAGYGGTRSQPLSGTLPDPVRFTTQFIRHDPVHSQSLVAGITPIQWTVG